jgi:hypothetical protein
MEFSPRIRQLDIRCLGACQSIWRNFLPGVQDQFILRASPLLSQPSDQVKLSRRDAARRGCFDIAGCLERGTYGFFEQASCLVHERKNDVAFFLHGHQRAEIPKPPTYIGVDLSSLHAVIGEKSGQISQIIRY